jgi:predicted nucleic acid-binding protein
MVFVDTRVWFAKFVPDDPNHSRVTAWFDANTEQVLTTDYCVDEVLTLFVARRRPSQALIAGKVLLEDGLVDIHFITKEQIARAWILFKRRSASGWSFTDCTSKIVIDDLNIQTAATLDDHFRHFGNLTVVP